MQYKGTTKLFECESGGVYRFPINHCVFCRHCTDLFYDYTNGPYMFSCDLDLQPFMTEFTCTCDKFEDTGYVFDEDEYKARMEERRKSAEMLQKFLDDNKVQIDKLIGDYLGGSSTENKDTIYVRKPWSESED